jgi:hypothetical protein
LDYETSGPGFLMILVTHPGQVLAVIVETTGDGSAGVLFRSNGKRADIESVDESTLRAETR